MVTESVNKQAARKQAPRKKPAPRPATPAAAATKATLIPSLDDLGQIVGKLKLPGVDVAAIVDSQRQDMAALAEANRQAYQGIKALAKRRDEILKEALMQWQAAMNDANPSKDGLSQNAERAKNGVQQAIASMRELAEMEAQSRSTAWKVVQSRFLENLANLQQLLQAK